MAQPHGPGIWSRGDYEGGSSASGAASSSSARPHYAYGGVTVGGSSSSSSSAPPAAYPALSSTHAPREQRGPARVPEDVVMDTEVYGGGADEHELAEGAGHLGLIDPRGDGGASPEARRHDASSADDSRFEVPPWDPAAASSGGQGFGHDREHPPSSAKPGRTEDDVAPLSGSGPSSDLPKFHPSRLIADHAFCCVFLGLCIVLSIVGIGVATLPMKIETSFDSFLITDVESSIRLNAFENALDSRAGYSRRLDELPASRQLDELSGSRQLEELSSTTIYMSKDLFLNYELREEGQGLKDGIFHSKAVSEIAKFERRLRDLPEWKALCARAANSSKGLCEIGMSWVRYTMPTRDYDGNSLVPSQVVLDGQGWDPVSARTALLLAEQQRVSALLLPEGYNFSSAGDEPRGEVLRSAFRFKLPCCTTRDTLSERRAATTAFTEEWEAFFRDILLPVFEEYHDENENRFLNVWYDGTDITAIEVKQALAGDFNWAVAAFVYVHIYLLIHTQNFILAALGPFIAVLSVPLTFVLCGVVIGTTTVSFANFLALFLIVGFGADVIFVYTDFWEESATQKTNFADRLAWTYDRAIRSSITTTGTTALAFFANLASVIRALRQFGFFMGMCVMLAWLLITTIYAPLLLVAKYVATWWQRTPAGRRFSRGGTPHGEGFKMRSLIAWAKLIHRLRYCIFILTIIGALACVGVSVPQAKAGDSLPSIFPEGHNQNQGAKVRELFESIGKSFTSKFTEPKRNQTVCNTPSLSRDSAECALNWCEAKLEVPRTGGLIPPYEAEPVPTWQGNGSCTCFRKEKPPNSCTLTIVKVLERFIGPAGLTENQVLQDVADYMVQHSKGVSMSTSYKTQLFTSQSQISPTLMQEWETGVTNLLDTVEFQAYIAREDKTTSPCGWEDMCFCSVPSVCSLGSGWKELPPLQIQPIRRLDTVKPKIKSSKRTKVRIVFGLQVPNSVQLLGEADPSDSWEFLPNFDLRQPWSQRNIQAFCTNTPTTLRVTRMWCWMQDFREYVRKETGRFPCRSTEFEEMALKFIASGQSPTKGTRYLWVLGGEVKALYVSTEIDVHKESDADVALEYKARWDEYIDEWNAEAFKTAKGAFHASELWVRAESASELIMSTLQTLGILFTLAFLAMFLFTRSVALSLYVVLATTGVVCGLAFFIIIINGWNVGLIEVIAIIYFIGYALDYSLHIAYKYRSPDAVTDGSASASLADSSRPLSKEVRNQIRLERTTFAVKSIGGAVIGSALTTAGASFFLVFCNLTLFNKLGAMCLAVTLFSVIIALGPLPACLFIFGPSEPGCTCRRRRGGPAKQGKAKGAARE